MATASVDGQPMDVLGFKVHGVRIRDAKHERATDARWLDEIGISPEREGRARSHLQLPKPLTPIELPEPKSIEREKREVQYIGEVQYVPPPAEVDTSSGCYCTCWRRRRAGTAAAAAASRSHHVDVQMSHETNLFDAGLEDIFNQTLDTVHHGPESAKCPAACTASAELVRVALPEEVTVSIAQPAGWAASPMLKGMLRSPFLNAMRSVSRDHPGRAYRRRTASAPAVNVGEELEASTASRVAFSVHA